MGCPTSYDGMSATWSKGKLSRLSSGTLASGTSNYTYTYNAFGQRLAKTYSYLAGTSGLNPVQAGQVINYSKKYSYDHAGRLIAETINKSHYNASATVEHIVYLYDENSIVGIDYTSNGATYRYFFQRNLQGDVTAIFNTSGTIMAKYLYDAWGNCTISSETTNYAVANANPIRYRGYYYDDDTGLYYCNARYYSPKWRRFISPDDTAYLDPESPNGLNLYCYCNNDPVNLVDPSGHDWNWKTYWSGLLMIGTAVSAIALSVATFGATTPLAMTVVAGITLGAGVLTGINGVATIMESALQYNFVRDGVFNGLGLSDSAYDVYAWLTEGIAALGSMALGIYRATPSGRKTMADNELFRIIDDPQRIQRYTFDQFGDLAKRSSWDYRIANNGKGMKALLNDKAIRYSMNGTRFDAAHFGGKPYWAVSSAKYRISKFLYLF